MTILSNTLTCTVSSSGPTYYISSLPGHLDIIWTADDFIEALNSGDIFSDFLREKVLNQLPRSIYHHLTSYEDIDLTITPLHDRLNAIRVELDMPAWCGGSLSLSNAIDLGYKPGQYELGSWAGGYLECGAEDRI